MSKEETKAIVDDSAYEGMEGVGYDSMGGDKFTMPLLLIAQTTSSVVAEGTNGIKAGDFYNSVTKENYGNSIELIPVYFESVWQIWKPNLGGFAGRVRPNSIKVTGDVYKGMKDADGNDVVDTWMYIVLIKGREEDGLLIMQVASNGIRYAKIWNGMIHDTRMTSGKRAPFFYSSWLLTVGKTKFDSGYSYSFGEGTTANIIKGDMVPPDTYLKYVKESLIIAPSAIYGAPQIEAAPAQLALADTTESKY
jgi:hypothetical protein